MSSDQENLNKYYSYVKDLYIEVKDYKFLHSPSGKSYLKDRFIGRAKLLERLKSLLTSSENQSGAYLVTGFRGMGKSSLVNEVLDELSPQLIHDKIINRLIRISFLLSIVAIAHHYNVLSVILTYPQLSKFNFTIYWHWLPLVIFLISLFCQIMWLFWNKGRPPMVLVVLLIFSSFVFELELFKSTFLSFISLLSFAFIWLAASDRDKNDLHIVKKPPKWIRMLKGFGSIFSRFDEKYSKTYHFYFISDVSIVFLLTFIIQLISWVIWWCYGNNLNSLNQLYHLLAHYRLREVEGNQLLKHSITLGNTISVYFSIPILFIISRFTIKFLREGKSFITRYFINPFNYSRRINIKINLGHRHLNEVEVLRLMTKKLTKSYDRISRPSWGMSSGISRILIKFSLVFFLLTILYSNRHFKYNHDQFKEHIGFSLLFPSQNTSPYFNSKNGPVLVRSNYPKDLSYECYLIVSKEKRQENWFNETIYTVTAYIDINVVKLYRATISQFPLNHLTGLNNLSSNEGLKSLFPLWPDYLFIFYFVIIWFLLGVIFRYRPLGLITHSLIKKQLSDLDDRIDSQVRQEAGASVGNLKSVLRIFQNKEKTYPLATAREIENELLSILNDVGKIPRIFIRPEFVFVFDELDKVEFHENKAIQEKETKDNLRKNNLGFSDKVETLNNRQEKVAAILANLKQFFTTANAKFIFIAGREMYDASLADTSDRNSFLGSIFHDVIYVNSFLTEDSEKVPDEAKRSLGEHKSYHNTLVEQFVCQFLIPKKWNTNSKSWSLKTYNEYLNTIHNKNDDDNTYRINYTILHLRNFIRYLTYRSGGSPKKLNYLLERYMVLIENDIGEIKEKHRLHQSVIIGKSTANFYLKFEYFDLYTFGVMNYLTTPFLHNISRQIRHYDDKLMVSSTYILDHLYKFHNSGFSWRNLEVTPEIVDVNKAPHLRRLIEEIVQFLTYLHLDNVVSNLYDFRFNKRLGHEIDMLSEANSRESAAFNFSLDESREIKKHYQRKLNDLYTNYKFKISNGVLKDYIHSLGFVHGNLGDLYYYDKEYDDAIIQYKEATQLLRNKKSMSLDQLVVYIRLMLKMGLALEKKKSYTSALLTYEGLAKLVVKEITVNLNISNIEIIDISSQKIEPKKFIKEYIENRKNNWAHIDPADLEDMTWIARRKPKNNETTEIFLCAITEEEVYIKLSELPLEVLRFANQSKISAAGSIRILYQPFLAKFYLKEKEKIGGVKTEDVRILENEIHFITRIIGADDQALILAEYYNKIGDLLYFKNSLDSFKNICLSSLNFHFLSLYHICQSYLDPKNYKSRIDKEINGMNSYSSNSIKFFPISKIILLIKKGGISKMTYASLKVFCNSINDLGDLMLASVTKGSKKGPIKINGYPKMLRILEEIKLLLENSRTLNSKMPTLNEVIKYEKSLESYTKLTNSKKIEFSFIYYLLSIELLHLNGDYKRSAFQLVKVIYFLKEFTPVNDSKFNDLRTSVVEKAIKYTYKSYMSSSHLEINLLERLFKEKSKKENYFYLFQHLPAYVEIQEILALNYMINLKSNFNIEEMTLGQVGTFTNFNIPSMYSRLTVLNFKVRYNYYVRSLFILDNDDGIEFTNANDEKIAEILESSNIAVSKQQHIALLHHLIVDSMYCFTSIIRILKLFKVSYISNHSLYAFAYEKRAEWCELLESLSPEGRNELIENKLKRLIGSQTLDVINTLYNYEKAINHYELAIQTHQDRYGYKNIVESMYYLDDDFNDDYYHFHAAIEKYRVNSGRVKEKIEKLRNFSKPINHDGLLEISNYLQFRSSN